MTHGQSQTSALAESANGEHQNRQQQLRNWFWQFYEPITDFAYDNFTALDLDTVLHRLACALPKCKATSGRQFLQWAKNRIARMAEERQVWEMVNHPTISDVLTLAASRPAKKAKPLVYESYGNRVFIKLEDAQGRLLPWIIPADWLPIAKVLWPVHIKQGRNGPFVSRKVPKQHLSGEWGQIDLPLHRLFLNCSERDIVDTKDGNLLNWCDGNLQVRHSASEPVTVPLDNAANDLFYGWKPARSKRVPVEPIKTTHLNAHERKVWRWLQGMEV